MLTKYSEQDLTLQLHAPLHTPGYVHDNILQLRHLPFFCVLLLLLCVCILVYFICTFVWTSVTDNLPIFEKLL